jgi:hypothetical protein
MLAVAVALALALPAAASAAPPPGFVGMSSDDLYGKAGPYRDKALAQQQAAGVQLLRATFSWAAIEINASGSRDYTNYDKYILDAARHNITVLPVLFDPPAWQSARPPGNKKHGTYPPKDFGAMASWAAEAVDRYGPNGLLWRNNPTVPPHPITSWQIWNEPNLGVYWLPKANAKQYLSLLRTVGDAIKSRDPTAEIVTAGMPDSRLGYAIRLAPYLKAFYKGGGSSAFDTLAINSYAVNARYLGKLVTTMRKLVNGIGGSKDKIWITEVGWCDKGVKSRFCVGAKGQAKNIGASLALMKKKRKTWKLRGFVLFNWRDGRPFPGGSDEWGLHAGLLTVKGKKKPAYNVFVRGVKRF